MCIIDGTRDEIVETFLEIDGTVQKTINTIII
jgi:hypothetical protein